MATLHHAGWWWSSWSTLGSLDLTIVPGPPFCSKQLWCGNIVILWPFLCDLALTKIESIVICQFVNGFDIVTSLICPLITGNLEKLCPKICVLKTLSPAKDLEGNPAACEWWSGGWEEKWQEERFAAGEPDNMLLAPCKKGGKQDVSAFYSSSENESKYYSLGMCKKRAW